MNWHVTLFTDNDMTGIDIQWRHLGQELLCTKRRQEEYRRGQDASMVGIVNQHLITLVTCVVTFQRQRYIEHPLHTICFRNTDNYRRYQINNAIKKLRKRG